MKNNIIKDRHKYIFTLIGEKKFSFLLAIFFMLIMATTNAGVAFLVKPLIDDIFVTNNVTMLKLLPILIVSLYFIRGISMYGQEYFMVYVGKSIILKLRNKLYSHIQDQSLSFFYKETTGALMSRITNDITLITGMVSSAVTGTLRDVFTVLALIIVVFYRDWQLAIVALVILPMVFYPVIKFGQRIRRVSTKTQEANASLGAFLFETLSGNKIVKAFGMESYEKKRFEDQTNNVFKLEMKVVVTNAMTSPLMEFMGGGAIAFVIWYGGFAVMNGYSTAGNFFSFLTAVMMLYEPIKKLSKVNNVVQEGMSAVDRVFDIIELDTDIDECENPVDIKLEPHRVEFKDVSFRYNDEETVLNDINIRVDTGEVIALVGMSGGGKSTLINLIPRFYDVATGSVLIDGLDVKEASIKSLRKQIAIVTQEPILFNDSIKNNIMYGKRDATIEEIEEASKAAYAYDFIQELPDKFDTVIGESGSRLSGGQKQRLSIARALIKDAPILILDEATSALDSEAEKVVQKALENLMRGRTTFVIAHRLSTIAYANRIIVIVNGNIIEEGTHKELLEKKGEYFKLYNMQFNEDST
ncbi:MAG: lipid A export permease/ATP-binding protein MsbA, partial [Desulfobacterales bacterium]|nr:lipid A export permease/ATP-binding protein MsbA [Desulfobacterales bacterium]